MELLIHTPMGKNITIEVQCICAVPFAFDFTDSAYSQSYLGQHLPPSPSVKFFHTFVMEFISLLTSCIHFWDHGTFKICFRSLRFTLYALMWYGFQ